MKNVLFYPKLEPNRDFHYMPLSALSVASKMLADGDDVVIIDDRVDNRAMERVLEELENWLYISVYTGYQVTRAYELSKLVRCKMPWVNIVWGGPHINALGKQTLESTFVDDIWEGYAECGEYRMPWELVNYKDYINWESERFIYVSTYSCPGVCTFCATKNKRKWIELPMAKVKGDIDALMSLHKYKECVFFDATIFTNGDRAFELGEIMTRHNLEWIADARALEIVRFKDEMKKLPGLKRLTVGLESGSDRVVQMMRKGKKHLETFKECAKILYENDIGLASGVIFGCPGEGTSDILQTIDYIKQIKRINPDFKLSTTFFMPLPDTIMADEAKKYGYTEPDTLRDWAAHGANGHFKYNQWMNNPWISNIDEYKKIYDNFIGECNYLI